MSSGSVISAEFRTAIQRLLELTGAMKMGEQMLNQLLANIPMPPELLERGKAAMFADIPNLVEQLIELYAKHMTYEDVLEITRFYETPAGSRMLAAMPAITMESMEIGRVWGETAFSRAIELMDAGQ